VIGGVVGGKLREGGGGGGVRWRGEGRVGKGLRLQNQGRIYAARLKD